MKRRTGVALAFALFLVTVSGGQADARRPRQSSLPDLTISAISAPSSTSPGKTIAVSSSIQNQGKVTSVAFSMSYYLSTTTSKTSASPLLGVQNVGSLPAGTSVALVTSLVIPPTTSLGTFYVVGIADSTAVVKESSELNNSASSGAISVKDSTPPTISAVTSSGVTASSATITWKTDEPSSSQVEYGATTAYGSMTALAASLVTNHSVTLSGLTAGSVYHLRVHSKDSSGNGAQSGDVTLTTASPTASAITTTGPTYYVATTGSDADPGTQAQPFRTITRGASVLTPGATLYVMGGTYAEALHNAISGGTSWSQPVTVAAYPGQTVTLRPNPGAERVVHFQGTTTAYIIVEGFILDATNVTYDAVKITYGNPGDAAHHIRLKDCEVKNARNQGILVTAGSNGNEFIDLDVHDNGITDFNHGLYISSEGNLVEGSSIHRNAGWGVQVYAGAGSTAHNNVIRNNAIFDNARVGGRGPGIILSSGNDNVAYNNLVWGNTRGIHVDYGAVNAKVYNNTVYANRDLGILVGQGSQGTLVQNNIIYQNLGPSMVNDGGGTLQDHNLIDIDPRFVSAGAADFRLNADSPAINVGRTISLVATDFADIPRPQGGQYDIGAFEY